MSRIALNKLNYKRFADKCRGARVDQLKVQKLARRGQVVLKYNAGGARGAKLMNGEWIINGTDEVAEKAIDEALEIFRKDFLLSLGAGLEGRVSAGGASEGSSEGASATGDSSKAEAAPEAAPTGDAAESEKSDPKKAESKKAPEPEAAPAAEKKAKGSAKAGDSEKAPKAGKKAGKGK